MNSIFPNILYWTPVFFGIINILLAVAIQFRRYHHTLTIPLFSLSLLFPLYMWFGLHSITIPSYFSYWPIESFPHKIFITLLCLQSILICEFSLRFMRQTVNLPETLLNKQLITRVIMYALILVCIFGAWLLPWGFLISNDKHQSLLSFNSIGISILAIIFGLYSFSLFLLENTYRFAQPYQKKIGRVCFLSAIVIVIYQLFFYGKALLYQYISFQDIETSIVVFGICWPFVLIGFFRYRLGSEMVSIPRDAVYSSISLLMIGAVCSGIGITASMFKWFNIDFSYFEKTLAIFSSLFFVILVLGSGTIRARIIRFVNTHFYTFKYDYREQFFNLHRSFMTGDNLGPALIELVENMKWSVTADDAFIFIVNEQDGDYYMHPNQESAVSENIKIPSDSIIITEMKTKLSPIDLRISTDNPKMETIIKHPIINQLKIKAIFPIAYQKQLLGIMGLRFNRNMILDKEDYTFIEVFTNSIADVVFKNKILRERIEQKQFESFTHLSSFIVHDIKNQVATLDLILKNAQKNIQNPDFQLSLFKSLSDCTKNLQELLVKLKRPPRIDSSELNKGLLNPIIEKVIDETNLKKLENLTFKSDLHSRREISFDTPSIYYTLKNLIVNALEAMDNKGTLKICSGDLPTPSNFLTETFGGAEQFYNKFSVFIVVSDSGHGISDEFIKTRLFHPFATTKDKGIGIGLYQCKTLVEKMNGKLLCHSVINEGTSFCILL